ncbi:MAG TPA: AraC family transcriptional regulator [Rhodoblastus sp.]|nr:AraC family transcriptional regulator [Rhodoblastus sp.]
MVSRTTSSPWFKGVIDTMAMAGLDTADLMRAAEIDPAVLRDRDGRIATEQMSRLWRVAAERTGDPKIGLIGSQLPMPGNFDVVGYTMLSSRNLREALESISRHMRLVSDAAEVMLEPHGQNVLARFGLYGGREPIPRQRIEFDLLTILNFCRWVAGRPIEPVVVGFIFPEPADVAAYRAAFQCPLRFGAEFNGWVFSPEILDAPLPAFHPMVAELHDNLLQQRLAAFDGARLSVRVRREIAGGLAQGEPRRESIAHALKMSDRTLQRRLHEEGVTFDRLLDATRCDLAQHYLARPNLTTADVAYLLGFADPGTFFRACKRWFDASPTRLRASILDRQRRAAD